MDLGDSGEPGKYITTELARAVSEILARKDFYEAESWSKTTLPKEATELRQQGSQQLDGG